MVGILANDCSRPLKYAHALCELVGRLSLYVGPHVGLNVGSGEMRSARMAKDEITRSGSVREVKKIGIKIVYNNPRVSNAQTSDMQGNSVLQYNFLFNLSF